jgi:hypothetical protein
MDGKELSSTTAKLCWLQILNVSTDWLKKKKERRGQEERQTEIKSLNMYSAIARLEGLERFNAQNCRQYVFRIIGHNKEFYLE